MVCMHALCVSAYGVCALMVRVCMHVWHVWCVCVDKRLCVCMYGVYVWISACVYACMVCMYG